MLSRVAYAVPLSLLVFTNNALARDVVDLAASLIGRPYVWGEEGPDAFDCSGLTQYVYKEFERTGVPQQLGRTRRIAKDLKT